jgi:hypothetical protein
MARGDQENSVRPRLKRSPPAPGHGSCQPAAAITATAIDGATAMAAAPSLGSATLPRPPPRIASGPAPLFKSRSRQCRGSRHEPVAAGGDLRTQRLTAHQSLGCPSPTSVQYRVTDPTSRTATAPQRTGWRPVGTALISVLDDPGSIAPRLFRAKGADSGSGRNSIQR